MCTCVYTKTYTCQISSKYPSEFIPREDDHKAVELYGFSQQEAFSNNWIKNTEVKIIIPLASSMIICLGLLESLS